jgi:transcriptional regulator with XRE-family HTH domain
MLWVIRPQALKHLRKSKGLTVPQLAKLSGLSVKQLNRLEAGDGEGSQEETVQRLAAALDINDPIAFAHEKGDPTMGDPARAAAIKRGAMPPTPQHFAFRSGVHKTGTDTKLAQRERLLDKDKPSIELAGRKYSVISFNLLADLKVAYADRAGETFALCGMLRDEKVMPQDVAKLLKAEPGRRASYFKIRTEVPGISATRGPGMLTTAVYVRNGNHGTILHNILMGRERASVTILVKIEIASTTIFPTFDPSEPFWSWAFVATAIISEPTPITYERDPGK